MVETFLSGFASSFNQARARTEDANAEQENTMFRYKMDNLMEQKKKREAKSAQETENSRKAKDLAGQMGDPDSAPIFYKEIANGVDYETLQKRIISGDYQKNSSYKAPTQTIKMPTPVSAQYDTDPGANPLAPKPGTGLLAKGTQKQYDNQMKSVNDRIDQIDPSLRSEVVNPKEEYSVTQDDQGSKYLYKPKNQYKLGDYGDALYKQSKAVESGDPVAIREANEEVKIHQRIASEKAALDAHAQGKDAATYVSINPDGSIGAQFTGERREDGIYNISNENQQLVSGPIRRMGDEEMKRLYKLQDDFGKASGDYNAASTNFVGALDSSQKMTQLLHDDRDAATTSSNVLGMINNLSGEAKATFSALNEMENTINSKAQSGNLDGIEKDIADYNRAASKFVGGGFLSEGNKNKALNGAMFRSLQMQTAYAIAQANASDGKVSKNDLDNAMQIIGKSVDPEIITKTVNQQMQGAFLKITSAARPLENNPSVIGFEKQMGLKTGLRPTRIGDQIEQMDWPPEQKALLHQYLKNINKDFVAGQAQTNATANPPPAQVQPTPGVEFNGMVIPEEAVGILKGRPDKRTKDFFDSQFGKGAADRVLGGK